MRIDTTFVASVLPILKQLAVQQQTPLWNVIGELPSLEGILSNGRVAEEGGRHLTFEEWTSMWTDAVGARTNNQLGLRQRFMYDNMRTAVAHLDELTAILSYFDGNWGALGTEVVERVKNNLAQGAVLPEAITMVLGTTSFGYVNDEGIFIDLVMLYMFYDDVQMIKDLLAHESWHFGHGSLLEDHPHANDPWFMPLVQLQSEGIVNHIIGGTYQLNQYRTKHSEGDAREESRRFVEYFDSFERNATLRMNELLYAIEKLLIGNVEEYMEYARSLPDIPGYLHGVFMSRQIHDVFDKDTLIQSTADPVRFILLSVDALRRKGLMLNVSNEALQHWRALCR